MQPDLSPEAINQLTDLVFFARFPRQKGKGMKGFERVWTNIKKLLTNPRSTAFSNGFIIDLTTPRDNPTPDFSKTADQLGVLEAAIFQSAPPFKFSTQETVLPDGKTGSYISSLSISFDQPRFAVLIDKDLRERSQDQTLETRDRNNWRRTLALVIEHANAHLAIDRQVAKNLEKALQVTFQQLLPLPTAKKPIPVARKELDEYMQNLGEFITVLINREFGEKTCDWEKADYPALADKIRKVGVMGISPRGLIVKCASRPDLPDIPLPPIPL